MLTTLVPLGERRSSGMSALHSTYVDESHLLVEVSVTEVKEGCALGIVLEHLDETGLPIAAENVSIYVGPRAHQRITTTKGCRLRIKWILVGVRPSSTFSVVTEGMTSVLEGTVGPNADVDLTESVAVDLTTVHGLREYVGVMLQTAGSQYPD